MSTNSLTKAMTQDLYRLILCLASAERQTVLFDRISDEDEELEEDGVTEEIVKAGIEWWENNIPLINEIAKSFTKSFMDTADDNNFNVGTFFDQWGIETWSDFISESFECIWSFGNNDDFDYFFDYAVKQSLGFNIGTWEGEDSQGARGIEISNVEWEIIYKVFQAFWLKKDVFDIFAWIHQRAKEGMSLVNL